MAPTLVISHGFESNYVVGFARGLVADGVPVTVLSSDALAPALRTASIPQENIRGSEAASRSAGAKLVTYVHYLVRLLWIVFRHRGQPVHFVGLFRSEFIAIEGLLLPPWFRCWGRPYIHTAHNALPHSRETSRFFRTAYRWIYRFPHVIVAHTPKVARQLTSDFGVEPERMRVISIGLNEEVPTTELSRDAAREALRLPANGRVALFFGKIEPYKGVDLLIEAWGLVRNPDTHVVIAGWCPDPAYARRLRELIAGSPRRSTIEWREGFVPNDKVAMWLKAADVVVMPYRHIYQSGVVFLCLAFGVPMVASNVGSFSDYLAPDSLAPSNDPAGIALALDRFFARPLADRTDAIRQAEKYRWDRQCAAIADLYA